LETFHLRLILEVEAIGLEVGRISVGELSDLEKNIQEEERLAAAIDPLQKENASPLIVAFIWQLRVYLETIA
jgi:hypothetical protein